MLKLKRWFSSSSNSSSTSNSRERNKAKIRSSSLPIIKKLNETLEKFEGKERILMEKISIETERANNFTKSKNKQAVVQCMKRKTYYEAQLDQLGTLQLQLHEQMRMVEDAVDMSER